MKRNSCCHIEEWWKSEITQESQLFMESKPRKSVPIPINTTMIIESVENFHFTIIGKSSLKSIMIIFLVLIRL